MAGWAFGCCVGAAAGFAGGFAGAAGAWAISGAKQAMCNTKVANARVARSRRNNLRTPRKRVPGLRACDIARGFGILRAHKASRPRAAYATFAGSDEVDDFTADGVAMQRAAADQFKALVQGAGTPEQ